jgi:hypothetical protein
MWYHVPGLGDQGALITVPTALALQITAFSEPLYQTAKESNVPGPTVFAARILTPLVVEK